MLEQYGNENIPTYVIENHNNIEEMRSKSNKEFPQMKQNLIIGIRKTHKFVPNNKIHRLDALQCACIAIWCVIIINAHI